MQHIMIRIETDDFEAWKTQHYLHADNRATFGITDGPAYQDIDNPNAALFHIKTDDMDRAMQWFKNRHVQGRDTAGQGHRPLLLPRPTPNLTDTRATTPPLHGCCVRNAPRTFRTVHAPAIRR